MARNVAVLTLAMVAASTAHAAMMHSGSSNFLANEDRMRPDVVANTLVMVEEDWKKEAAASTGAKEAPASFSKSCSTVVSAVIQGSNGDRDVAREYMGKVCSQKVLAGWHALRCTALAEKITEHAMLADDYANRQNLNMGPKVCSSFWSVFVETERNREADEAKERAEKDKIRAEEEQKAAVAAAEAKKKADVAAKLEAEVHAKEEAKRSQEEKELKAKQEAAEAKARAAEAAARLAEKKAEAEKMQKEAQKKLEEAQEAEKEHQARQEEHQKAEEALKAAAKASPAAAKAATPPAPTKPTADEHVSAAGPPPLSPAAPAATQAAKPAAKPVVAVEVVKTPPVAKVEPAAAAKAAPTKVADKTTKK